MMRLIPGKTSVKIRLFKDISLVDMAIGALGVALIALIALTPFSWKLPAAIGLFVVFAIMLVRIDSEPVYLFVFKVFSFLISKKKYSKDGVFEDIREVMAFTDADQEFINYDNKYYGGVIEIPPVEFRFFSETRRKSAIENAIGAILRSIHAEQGVNIVKIERPISYESYIQAEYGRLEALKRSFENGLMTEEELKIRNEIIYDRINELNGMMSDQKVIEPAYFLVLFDADKRQLSQLISTAMSTLSQGDMAPRRVVGKELIFFLKYTNELDFDERDFNTAASESAEDAENVSSEEADAAEETLPFEETKQSKKKAGKKKDPKKKKRDANNTKKKADRANAWFAMPEKMIVRSRNIKFGKMIAHHFAVSKFPMNVGDSWMAEVMSIPSTKVVVKCTPTDHQKTIRAIDHSIQELHSQYQATGVVSKQIELKSHIDSLTALLVTLQEQNESLMDVNVYITAYDRQMSELIAPDYVGVSARRTIASMKQTIRRIYRENGMKISPMEFDQLTAFIGSQVSGYDPMKREGFNMPTNSVAAMFPWIFAHIEDEGGLKFGSNDGVPVMIDFFKRNSERVNSNMVIVGKSGSGKSYATKSILTNLAAEDSKIFVLDPENEYTEMAANLHGKFINVGNALQGRLNPFHIMTELEDDEDGAEASTGSYAMHMQFLEEFYKQILPDCERDALEYLNLLTDRMYTNHGITSETNLAKLAPEDYPTFDDLYDEILKEFQTSDNEYVHQMLRTLINYVSKFAAGGRNASIWNGPSTITTEENFTVFNFQSLLANRNQSIANAQMLLVLKYIDHEIIKNREYNIKHKKNRKVVVVIDEAHVFIDEKFPVALDFMFQLAKRIRKYNGMQIVITQNIKDFVGSEELARKSAAIINACQYSLIFSLAPNDMEDLCLLYEKSGGINKNEQEQIVTAPRGQAFFIMGVSNRATVSIEAADLVREIFENPTYETHYFDTAAEQQAWEDYIAESRIRHESERVIRIEEAKETAAARKHVNLVEIEELDLEDHGRAEEPSKSAIIYETNDADMVSDDALEDAIRAFEQKERAHQITAAEAVQTPTVPFNQNVTVNVKPEGFDNMMSQLTDLVNSMSRFSYEALREEMLRLISENMTSRPAGGLAETAGMQQTVAETTETAADKADEKTMFDFTAASQQTEEKESAGAAAYSDDDDDTPYFDIMKLLAQEAEDLSESSVIDDMIADNEMILAVTLDDLIAYNRIHG